VTTPADLTHIRAIDDADVYKADQLAGHLRRERDDVVFGYADLRIYAEVDLGPDSEAAQRA